MSTASSMRSHAYRRRQSFISRRNTQDDPAKLMEAVITDMRCLLICASLLERVNGVSRGRGDQALYVNEIADEAGVVLCRRCKITLSCRVSFQI